MQSSPREIVKETEFKKVQTDPSRDPSKQNVWLLTDMLIVAKRKDKNKFTFRLSLPLDSVVVWDLDPSGTSLEQKNGFSVFHTDPSINAKVVILASSPAEKTLWMELINSCIANTGFLS